MTISEVQAEIERLSGNDKKYADFSSSLIPGASIIYGVRLPEMRKLAKKIAKEDYKSFLENNPMDSFEMETLQAMVIGYAKDDINVILDYLQEFIPHIHDWSVNDTLCSTFKIAKKYPKEVYDFLMKYKDSDKEFESRVVSVMLMAHFLIDDYIDDVIEVLDGLNTDDYYSKMGVAWAVATIMAKYPEKCYSYMTGENHLDNWTYNKSIQKMKESFRVSDEMKRTMNELKRK